MKRSRATPLPLLLASVALICAAATVQVRFRNSIQQRRWHFGVDDGGGGAHFRFYFFLGNAGSDALQSHLATEHNQRSSDWRCFKKHSKRFALGAEARHRERRRNRFRAVGSIEERERERERGGETLSVVSVVPSDKLPRRLGHRCCRVAALTVFEMTRQRKLKLIERG